MTMRLSEKGFKIRRSSETWVSNVIVQLPPLHLLGTLVSCIDASMCDSLKLISTASCHSKPNVQQPTTLLNIIFESVHLQKLLSSHQAISRHRSISSKLRSKARHLPPDILMDESWISTRSSSRTRDSHMSIQFIGTRKCMSEGSIPSEAVCMLKQTTDTKCSGPTHTTAQTLVTL